MICGRDIIDVGDELASSLCARSARSHSSVEMMAMMFVKYRDKTLTLVAFYGVKRQLAWH